MNKKCIAKHFGFLGVRVRTFLFLTFNENINADFAKLSQKPTLLKSVFC